MSDNEFNEQRPTGPVEPASGENDGTGHPGGAANSHDANQGWRPSVAGAQGPADQSPPGAGDEPSPSAPGSSPDARSGDPAPDAVSGAPSGPVSGPHAAQLADETTTPQPYAGAPWPSPPSGQPQPPGPRPDQQPSGATPMPGATPTSGGTPTSGAAPTSGGTPTSAGGWQPGQQPGGYQPGGYQPSGYQPGVHPVGGYPTAQYQQPGYQQSGYQQPGYQPGAHQTTGGGYPGGPTTGSGYPGPYQQAFPAQGERRRRRPATLVAAGILGVLLAVGGGVAGAAWMHELDGNNTPSTTAAGSGRAPDNAPVIDRSSLASIAAAVRPSVVSITTSNATGSGVVISADGFVLTNNHVAATANGSNVDITLSDGTSLKGKLIGADPKTDLAVFQAQNVTKKLTPAKFGDSGALRVGDTVLAIGSPLGLDGSVTAGIVSALNRTIDESSDSQPQDPFGQGQQNQNSTPGATIAGAIQTDAPINPGNSGGALVNTNGEVVGINTAIATDGSNGNIGVGFAIPSNRANSVSQDIIKGVAVQHPYIGIGVVTAAGNGGAQVQQVTAGSPAASAGLKVNDVITTYNGKPVHTSDDLVNDVQSGNVKDQVTLTVERGGSSMQIKVTLGESK